MAPPHRADDPPPITVPREAPAHRDDLESYLGAFTNYETQGAILADRRALGPRRCRTLLDRAGLIPPAATVIQVAGSKGKGSTVLWMESLLSTRGEAAVSYLSPHLEHLEERIRLHRAPISSGRLVAAVARLHRTVLEIARDDPELLPTFFDLFTAAAVSVAAETEASWLLLEVGLGGPLDSTTAIEHHIGVLTTVDLEHREWLGPTLEAIAMEKARIARPGRPFLIAADEGQDPVARDSAAAIAATRGARVHGVTLDPRLGPEIPEGQRGNLSLALAALEAAGARSFTEEEIAAAATAVELPARLETLPGPPPLLLDGAHTVRSVARFVEELNRTRRGRPATVLLGVMADKEWRIAFAPLREEPDLQVLVTAVAGPRAADPEPIAAFFREMGGDATVLPLEDAIDALRAAAPRVLAVTGSFRLAGEVRKRWRE